MTLNIASYNLFFHKAYPELNRLAISQKLDILCVQECFTDELDEKAGHLTLAEAHTYALNPRPAHPRQNMYSPSKALSGNLGLALYYDKSKLVLVKISDIKLPLPWQERKGGRTMQVAQFKNRKSGERFAICNIHLSALWSTNRARLVQAKAALEHIKIDNAGDQSIVIAGDFNFPIRGHSLRQQMEKYGMQECGIHRRERTHVSKLVSDKFDRVFISDGFIELDYEILPFGSSDHAPVKVALKPVEKTADLA